MRNCGEGQYRRDAGNARQSWEPEKVRRSVELRTAVSPKDVKHYTTDRLREEFLIQNLFVPGEIKLVYSHIDRIITGAAVPVEPLTLTAGEELRAEYF